MRRIGFIVCPGFQLIGFTASAVFEIANLLSEPPAYEISVLSEAGGLVRGSASVSVETRRLDDVSGYDTLIVCVSMDLQQTSPEMLDLLRAAAPATRRIGAICTGAFVLAEAGLLRGRRATTHWMSARELARRFPDTFVEEDRIFVADQGVWTSAGMTAGLDLALAMVEEDLGRELARSVARAMVLYHRRSGGQSQHSALLELEPKSDRIQSALTYAKSNLKKPLTLDELADAARLSSRQFSRAFREETGQTPAKAVERLRVEAARLMLEEGRHTVETVAYEIGFGDRERMRRAFLRNIGLPPQAVRRTAQL
ncbi:MAG TPA: GlxA family transcriptional regulator [Caulobacteraceae bacterium]